MCLSIPGKITEIQDRHAKVEIGGTIYTASLELLEDVRVGDYVLVHAGFAIQKLDEQEALETLSMFDELEMINNSDNQSLSKL